MRDLTHNKSHAVDELGDTGRWLRQSAGPAAPEDPHDTLRSVNESLKSFPERADLWMMRFELQRSLRFKAEFSVCLVAAWNEARVSTRLDWPYVRAMWDDLAPGEPIPGGIKLPEAAVKPAPREVKSRTGCWDRFSDLAPRIAPRELAILAKAYATLRLSPGFLEDYLRKCGAWMKRPTSIHFAEQLSRVAGGKVRIFLKREDRRAVPVELENAAAQCYLATRLSKTSVVTGNDVEAHSLAMADMAPRFGLKCTVIINSADTQGPLAAQLRGKGVAVETTAGLPMIGGDPREGALRLWQQARGQAHLALSLGSGPEPYPGMVQDMQSVIGRETELQLNKAGSAPPPRRVAAVSSEADAIGFMAPYLEREDAELVYAENDPNESAARISRRLSAYNGCRREHARLRSSGRIEHVPMPDRAAVTAQQQLGSLENISVSLEDARAVALTLLLSQYGQSERDFAVLVA